MPTPGTSAGSPRAPSSVRARPGLHGGGPPGRHQCAERRRFAPVQRSALHERRARLPGPLSHRARRPEQHPGLLERAASLARHTAGDASSRSSSPRTAAAARPPPARRRKLDPAAVDVNPDFVHQVYPLVGFGYAVIAPDLAGYANFGGANNPPSAYADTADVGKIDSRRSSRAPQRPALVQPPAGHRHRRPLARRPHRALRAVDGELVSGGRQHRRRRRLRAALVLAARVGRHLPRAWQLRLRPELRGRRQPLVPLHAHHAARRTRLGLPHLQSHDAAGDAVVRRQRLLGQRLSAARRGRDERERLLHDRLRAVDRDRRNAAR